MEFEAFPKMSRLNREIIITEKIDGTNAQILIDDASIVDAEPITIINGMGIWAGSRTRFIYPNSDNYGFAKWVCENAEDLLKLGVGRHFGEWWGAGIQRRYDMQEKRFSLFNTTRWTDDVRPKCCHVVPELYRGLPTYPVNEFGGEHGTAWQEVLHTLKAKGSVAAPGFMDPEGIVVYHTAAGVGFKVTLKDDEVPKTLAGK
jgi:hypothetical protein